MGNLTQFSPTNGTWTSHWLPLAWVQGLHRRFSMLYLTRFTSSFQDQETIDEWCQAWGSGLSGFTGAQIKHGLEYVSRHSEWPPTIAEFRAACESCPPADVPKLPEPARADQAHALRQLAKIKEMLATPFRKPGKWWAEEILEQHKAGLHVLPKALDLAMEALREREVH